MKRPITKLRPAITAALVLSMAVPAPAVQAAELDALQAASGSPQEAAPEPPAEAPPAQDAPGDADGTGTDDGNGTDEGAAADGNVDAPPAAGEPAGDAAAPSAPSAGAAGAGDAAEGAPAALAEGDVAVDEKSFPDAAFRAWVLDPANLGGAGADGVLTRAEREAVTSMRAARKGICDITGIELFPNLDFIDFEGNYIERADLSGNPGLLTVYLRNNCLTSIDFSRNTKLEFVEVFDNRLTEIDLSMLPNLKFAHLDYNDLRAIDLSHNLKLEGDGFVGNNNPLEKVVLPRIEGRSFDSFVISELDEYEGYASTLPEWYTTPDFQEGTGITPSTVADRTFIPFDGQTLHVRRAPNAYTVRFDANGGEGSMDDVARTWDDGARALPAASFGRLGYRFAGWSREPGGAASIADGQEVENIGGAKDTGQVVTLYAVWEPVAASSGYFRSQLGDAERAVYDDLVSQLGELTDPSDPGAVEVFAPDEVQGSLGRILFAALRDHPEYFWIDFSRLSWEQGSGSFFALAPRVSGESFFVDGFTAENLAGYRERFEARVGEVVAAAPSDPVLAVRYFNSWLAANNVYNPGGLGASNFSRTAASGILSSNDASSGPVCYGYATAMKVLLDRAGIENAYVEGWAFNGRNGAGEQHAWNYVSVAGSWYAVDPTWNDPAAASAPALETYLLVGSGTVTTPSLAGKETFGANHDPSRSPAATYRLGYPELSREALAGVSDGLVEVVGDAGSARFDTLEEGLAAAGAGQTVRLWGDADLSGTVEVARDVTMDMNGHGVSCASAPALRVAPAATLRLANSAGSQATLSSSAGAAVLNDGSLSVGPRVRVKGAGMSAVSGADPRAGEHAYLVRTTGAWTAYEVAEPAAPAALTVDVSDLDGTREGLVAHVNGAARPRLELSYLTPAGAAVGIPASAVPGYAWELVSAPEGEDGLARGTYGFRATVFGYELAWEVEVVDAALDAAVAEGSARAEEALAALESDAAAGLVTGFDLEAARAALEAGRARLAAAGTAAEAEGIARDILDDLAATPTVASRASGLADAWRSAHAAALAAVAGGSVTLEGAGDLHARAGAALAAAEAGALAGALPEGMGAADRALVATGARALLGDDLGDLEALAAASAWARGAADALAALPDPVTAGELDALQGLLDALDALDPDARALVSPDDAARLAALRDAAAGAAGSGEPGDGDGEAPGGNPGGDGGAADETPGDDGENPGGDENPGDDAAPEPGQGAPSDDGEAGAETPAGSGDLVGHAAGTASPLRPAASRAASPGALPVARAAAAAPVAGAPLAGDLGAAPGAVAEALPSEAPSGAVAGDPDDGAEAPAGPLAAAVAGAAALIAAAGAAIGLRRRS